MRSHLPVRGRHQLARTQAAQVGHERRRVSAGRAGGRAAAGVTRMGRKDTENQRAGGNLLVYDFRGNNVLQTHMAAAWVGGWMDGRYP